MIRRLLNLVTVLSLVLCVAAAAYWVRSYFAADSVGVTRYEGRRLVSRSIFIQRGVIGAQVWILPSDFGSGLPPMYRDWWCMTSAPEPRMELSQLAPRAETWGSGAISTYTLPCWVLLLLLSVPPTLAYRRRRSDRTRRVTGRCRSCGYDLTGNVSGVCPECGSGREGAPVEWPT